MKQRKFLPQIVGLASHALLIAGCLLAVPTQAMQGFYDQQWLQQNSVVSSQLKYLQHLDTLYKDAQYSLLWQRPENQEKFEFQLSLIKKAQLNDFFSKRLMMMQTLRMQNKIYEYELLATDTLIAYLEYVSKAPTKGMNWFFDSEIELTHKEPSQRTLNQLQPVFYGQSPDSQLDALLNSTRAPILSEANFTKAYTRLLRHNEKILADYKQSGLKRSGDVLPNRQLLIDRIAISGLDTSHLGQTLFGQDFQQQEDSNSIYDPTLVMLVKDFQSIHGLKPDGVIGPKTLRWINVDVEDRLKMLALNAERTRMWPKTDGSIVMVNVPGFEMSYWFGGEEVFESRVVVGKTARKTPIMSMRLDSVILNPTWNIPRKIMVEDIIPKVKRNRNYLSQNNIEIIPRWGSTRTINPAGINWATLNPKKFPYKMRQGSGKRNALGLFKFNTPNKDAIYLHDTPSKGLFNRDSRAFSSGCIRVEHPQKFASTLVDTLGSRKQLVIGKRQKYLGSNSRVPLRQKIPVHIIYQTVWFEGEQIQYRDDIYDYDSLDDNVDQLLTNNY